MNSQTIYEAAYKEIYKESYEEGLAEGMNELANAIKDLKSGMSKEEMLKKYDSQTVELAIACR